MTSQREAKAEGYNTGYGIAQMSWPPRCRRNLTKAGIEKFVGNCQEAEENARQMSPFEFTASAFNASRFPDEVWSAYDDGVAQGANAFVRDALKSMKKPKTKAKAKGKGGR